MQHQFTHTPSTLHSTLKRRILFVEDNIEIQQVLSAYFRNEYEIVPALTLAQAETLLEKASFDLVLLDLGLPDGNAFGLCHNIRKRPDTQSLPIIFMSALGQVDHKIRALQLGADDYLIKPVDYGELEARIESQIQKYKMRESSSSSNSEIEFYDLVLQNISQKVFVKAKSGVKNLILTRTEFVLLMSFISHPNQVFTLDFIKDSVWGHNEKPSSKTIEVHLSNLNRKLRRAGAKVFIRFVNGIGYRIANS